MRKLCNSCGKFLVFLCTHFRSRHPLTQQQITVSTGSGFIVSSDGLIVTNAHVEAGRRAVRVHLAEGRKCTAYLVAVDQATDIATLRINAKVIMFDLIHRGVSFVLNGTQQADKFESSRSSLPQIALTLP